MLILNRPLSSQGVVSQLLIAQGAGIVLACWVGAMSNLGHMPSLLLMTMAIQAIVAAVTARALGMEIRWVMFNLLFGAVLVGALRLQVHPFVYGVAFLTLLAVFGTGTLAHRVPLFLSSTRALAHLDRWLPQQQFSMIDLGAGTGSVLRFVASRRGDADLSGVEVAPLPFVLAWLRGLRCEYRVDFGNFWSCDLSRHDVVYAYLSPEPMQRLWDKASREMRPGSLFVSNSFAVPGVTPTSVVRYGATRGAVLHIWRMP